MSKINIDKIKKIYEYADATIVALDAQIEQTQSLINAVPLMDNRDEYMASPAYKSLLEDIKNEQSVREKIIARDYNLSTFEINTVALAFYYQSKVFSNQIETLNKLIKKSNEMVNILMAADK